MNNLKKIQNMNDINELNDRFNFDSQANLQNN